jgi:hypothetical protein
MADDQAKDLKNAIAALQAVSLFREAYASSEPGARLCAETVKALRFGGLLSKNIATAIEAWLANTELKGGVLAEPDFLNSQMNLDAGKKP